MEVAVRELKKVLKAMAQKVVYLEEPIVTLKDAQKKTDPYEPFKYTYKFKKLTPKSLNTDLTKQEQKLVIEKLKKVEDKVK